MIQPFLKPDGDLSIVETGLPGFIILFDGILGAHPKLAVDIGVGIAESVEDGDSFAVARDGGVKIPVSGRGEPAVALAEILVHLPLSAPGSHGAFARGAIHVPAAMTISTGSMASTERW